MRARCAVLLVSVGVVVSVAGSAVGDGRVLGALPPSAPDPFAPVSRPPAPPVAPPATLPFSPYDQPTSPRRSAPGLRPNSRPQISAGQPVVDAEIDSSKFALLLKDGTRLIGVPGNSDVVVLEVAFGRVEIPLRLLATVKFSTNRQPAQLRFKNGDTLTGRVVLDKLKFETSYGVMTIPIDELVVMSAGGKFPKSAVRPAPVKVASPRNTTRLLRLLTPRIIVQEEEEELLGIEL